MSWADDALGKLPAPPARPAPAERPTRRDIPTAPPGPRPPAAFDPDKTLVAPANYPPAEARAPATPVVAPPRADAPQGAVAPPPLPCFVLLNIDGGLEVDRALPAILDALVEGNATFVQYGGRPCSFRIGASPNDRDTVSEYAVNIRAEPLQETPGAAAYHCVVNGVPDIEVSVAEFDGLTQGQDPMSAGIDHEVKETLKDLGANGWKTGPDGTTARAEEECDEVQNVLYAASNGVMLTDFLLDSAFIPGAPPPWDYLGAKTSQEDDSHGYAIKAQVVSITEDVGQVHARMQSLTGANLHNGRIHYITGAPLTAKQLRRKSSPYSRTHRRHVRLSPPGDPTPKTDPQ